MQRILATLLFVFAPLLPAQAVRTDLAGRIDEMVKAELKAKEIPGASVLVAIGEKIVLEKGYGMADLENGVPVTPQTVFRIGSVTKQFTAAAILRLVDAGKLELDDELNKLLPEFQFPGKKVTVRQLLNHTSGIKSYTGLGPKFWSISTQPLKHRELFALIKDEPFDFAPGAGMKYNNSGYYLLGVIIEKVAGVPYDRFLADELFKPLGLKQTTYGGAQRIVMHRARGYAKSKGNIANAKLLSMRPPFSAGALLSTTRDLHRWNLALHRGKVMSTKSYAKMTTPVGKAKRSTGGYGFGLSIRTRGEHQIAHGGGINGFSSFLAYYPKHELTVAILYNTSAGQPGGLSGRVASAVLADAK